MSRPRPSLGVVGPPGTASCSGVLGWRPPAPAAGHLGGSRTNLVDIHGRISAGVQLPHDARPPGVGTVIAGVATAYRCYDALMRTTIDLPEDLHRAATSLARDRGRSLSQTVSDLVRRALRPEAGSGQVTLDTRTGLPVVYVGVPVTTEMVRAAIDEE